MRTEGGLGVVFAVRSTVDGAGAKQGDVRSMASGSKAGISNPVACPPWGGVVSYRRIGLTVPSTAAYPLGVPAHPPGGNGMRSKQGALIAEEGTHMSLSFMHSIVH